MLAGLASWAGILDSTPAAVVLRAVGLAACLDPRREPRRDLLP